MRRTSAEILERLVAFPTVSARSNLDIVDYIAALLAGRGIAAEILPSADGQKANLFATIGPDDPGGIILSGHTDVVPAEGQAWTSDPFRLAERDGRLYGRGTADMKGFLACVLSFAERTEPGRLRRPVHLCFSHDEEIGCVGVRPMLTQLKARALRPSACLVGEPTSMRVATGHKGKLAARATCVGVDGHSALAPLALNAIHLAADVVAILRGVQDELSRHGAQDADYGIPYSTIHAGRIEGGTALNIVPGRCTIDFEIRTVGAEDATALLERIRAEARRRIDVERPRFPTAAIDIEVINSYPGLATSADAGIVILARALTGSQPTIKVAFGTEGGLFAERLGVPTAICGPGSMDQGHRPDEYITRDQLDRCDAMLDRLAASLAD